MRLPGGEREVIARLQGQPPGTVIGSPTLRGRPPRTYRIGTEDLTLNEVAARLQRSRSQIQLLKARYGLDELARRLCEPERRHLRCGRPALHYTIGHESLTPVFSVPVRVPVIGGAVLSQEGLWYAVAVISRSVTLFLLAPLFLLTTDPNQLVVGLVRIRVPYTLAFAFTSMLRFFPLLLEELNAATEAQRLRGYAIESMGAVAKVRIYSQVAIPVILGTLHRAQLTEVVLQSRGFPGGSTRTFLHAPKSGPASSLLLVLSIAGLVLIVLARACWGFGGFSIPLSG